MTELVNTILDHVFTNKKLTINIPRMNDDEKKAFFKSLIHCIVYCIHSRNCDVYIKSKFDNRVTLSNVLKLLTENFVYIKSITIKPRDNGLFGQKPIVIGALNDEQAINKDEYNTLLREYFKLKCLDIADNVLFENGKPDESRLEKIKQRISGIYNKLCIYCEYREIQNKEIIDKLMLMADE